MKTKIKYVYLAIFTLLMLAGMTTFPAVAQQGYPMHSETRWPTPLIFTPAPTLTPVPTLVVVRPDLPIEMACQDKVGISHYSYYYTSDNPDIPLAHSRDLMYMADSETGGTRVVGWHIWDTQANGDPCNTGHTWLRYTYNEFNWY